VRIAVLVGNPKPASRTLGVATAVAGALSAELGVGQDHLIVDLAEHAGDLFDWGAPGLVQLTAEVASAGLIIAASPTYKATYTGMLKAPPGPEPVRAPLPAAVHDNLDLHVPGIRPH